MSKPLRICMIPGSTDGVNYYRLATWAFEMRKYKNVIVDLLWFKYQIDASGPHPWQEDFLSDLASENYNCTMGQEIRQTIEHFCQTDDVIIWHSAFYNHIFDFFLEMQHKYEKKFIVEADDNFIDVPPWNEAFRSFSPGSSYRRVAMDCIRNGDAVIVSTPHLKETYAPFNDNIHVVENSLDFKGNRKFVGWDRVSVRKHKGLRIGWIGGRSHFDDLWMVAPALRQVLEKHPEVSLHLVNSAFALSCEILGKKNPFQGLKNVHYADRSVAINRYAEFAASFGFDIGIAPLVDCNFNRSKSNLRWLEYSALKVPTVATDISHFTRSIENGKDGLLIKENDLQRWSEALEFLITDDVSRETIGKNAYKKVKQEFNVKRNAPKYLRILKGITEFNSVENEMAVI